MSVLEEIPEDPCEAVEFITLRLFDRKDDYYAAPVIRHEKRFELITLLEILDESCAACNDYAAYAETCAYVSQIAAEIVRQDRYSIVLSELETLAQEIFRVTTRRKARAFRGARKRRPPPVELAAMAEIVEDILTVVDQGAVAVETEKALRPPLRRLQTAFADEAVTTLALQTEADEIARICARTGPSARPIADRIAKLVRILGDEPLPGDATRTS